MLVSADIISAHRDGIAEEVARPGRASSDTGTWIDAGIDSRGTCLKSPLCGGLADAMIPKTIHQRILVVNAMWLW